MSALREILATFDIVVNSEQLAAGEKRVDDFVDKLKGLTAAVAGFSLVKRIVDFGEGIAEAARKAEFGAIRIGMGVEQYQKLSQVAENYGLTVEQLQVATRMFERALGDNGGTMGKFGARTHASGEALRALGLNAKSFKGQGLEEILPVVADGFAKIQDPIERTNIALRLFGHRGLAILPLLAKGGDNLRREMAAMVPIFEQATIDSADRATISGNQLSRTWQNLVNNSFGRALLDAMDWTARKLTDVVLAVKELSKHSEIGKGVLISLGLVAATAAGIFIAAWWPVLVPILAVIAAFAVLALAVDDFIVFMKGGDSLLGDFFDSLLGEGGAEKAQAFIKGMWEDLKGFLDELKSDAWGEFIKNVPAMVQDVRDAIKSIKDNIAWIEEHWKTLRTQFDSVAHMFGGGSADIHATTNVAGATTGSTFINNVAPPPEIGPPTAAQAATYGANSTGKPGDTYVINGNIDSGELARKMQTTVDSHVDAKLGTILRGAMAGAGGSK